MVTTDLSKDIDSAGNSDVTEPIGRALQQARGRLVFPEGGTFRCDSRVAAAVSGLTVEANGSTLVLQGRGDRERCNLLLRGKDVAVHDLNVVGAHPHGGTSDDAWVSELEGQAGIWLQSVDGWELVNVNTSDTYGDGIYVGATDSKAPPSRHGVIKGGSVKRTGRQGVSLVHAEYVDIDGTELDEIRRTMFDLEPNSNGDWVRHVNIRHVAAGTGRLNFVSAGGRGDVSWVNVDSNVLVGQHLKIAVKSVDSAVRRAHWSVTHNKADGVFGSERAIWMVGVDDLTVYGNRQHMQPRPNAAGVVLNDCTDYTVQCNDFGAVPELRA